MEPGQGIVQQFQQMLAVTEMKLADAVSSDSDLVRTSKKFRSSKFYTETTDID